MTAKLELTITGAQGFARGWDRISAAYGEDLRPFLRTVQSWWYDEQDIIFESEGRRIGRKWQKLKEPYKSWKDENFGVLPILQLTGKLKAAMTGASRMNATEKIDKKSMELGINRSQIPYWRVHNFGFKEQNIPMRKFAATKRRGIKALDKAVQAEMNELDREIQKEFDKGKDKKLR